LPRLLRRARTAVGLPGRIVAVEDRASALETDVVKRIEEIRFEIGEIRAMLTALLESDADTAELLGTLLRSIAARVELLEEDHTPSNALTPLSESAG
jgi:hypothetical protein